MKSIFASQYVHDGYKIIFKLERILKIDHHVSYSLSKDTPLSFIYIAKI